MIAGYADVKVMAAKQLWALDFDGVICDSCGESSLSAWKAATLQWPSIFKSPEAMSQKDEVMERMRSVRPVVETGVPYRYMPDVMCLCILPVSKDRNKTNRYIRIPSNSLNLIKSPRDGLQTLTLACLCKTMLCCDMCNSQVKSDIPHFMACEQASDASFALCLIDICDSTPVNEGHNTNKMCSTLRQKVLHSCAAHRWPALQRSGVLQGIHHLGAAASKTVQGSLLTINSAELISVAQ